MASAAAVSMLPRPPCMHPSPIASSASSRLLMCTLPFRRRPLHCSSTAYAVLRDDTALVPISAIGPVNDDKSIFEITLDLSNAPEFVASYTTPGQTVTTTVPSSGLRAAYIEIASAPHSGPQFDLLVKSVPRTTAERLCKLSVGDQVELGAVTGQGLPISDIKEAETVLLFAVAEGLSPIRALIKSGLRNNVSLYYGARNQESVPLQEELDEWQKSGVNVIKVLTEPVQHPFLRDPNPIVKNPKSTVAVLVGPIDLQQEVKKALTGLGVPVEKILTIAQWYPNY
ncbi:unnamed protein product [Urochloa decumbens]|uniref:FAD-binding FR-type domain-containing protein n=1 Tax=Urochloa decumbens TaxID=240449 RepID=A0ABC9FNP0_9POAL